MEGDDTSATGRNLLCRSVRELQATPKNLRDLIHQGCKLLPGQGGGILVPMTNGDVAPQEAPCGEDHLEVDAQVSRTLVEHDVPHREELGPAAQEVGFVKQRDTVRACGARARARACGARARACGARGRLHEAPGGYQGKALDCGAFLLASAQGCAETRLGICTHGLSN